MELHIITGTFSNENKWWAETTNLPQNIGVEMTNTTEQECIISLVKSYFRIKNNEQQHISEGYQEPVVPLSKGTQS